ncbi:MAG: diguanylate cyclase [Microthrixaceae bacterium]
MDLDAGSTEVATPAAPAGDETRKEPPADRRGGPLTDPATGLFSQDYLEVALESRLASARRHLRPVALAIMEVNQGLPSDGTSPADPLLVAEAIGATVRDSDIACRLEDGTFGLILEDTPENGAVWTVERIRRNLVSSSGHHTLWAGVACYPAHAFDGAELMAQVSGALSAAREWNQDRIEVAIAE